MESVASWGSLDESEQETGGIRFDLHLASLHHNHKTHDHSWTLFPLEDLDQDLELFSPSVSCLCRDSLQTRWRLQSVPSLFYTYGPETQK